MMLSLILPIMVSAAEIKIPAPSFPVCVRSVSWDNDNDIPAKWKTLFKATIAQAKTTSINMKGVWTLREEEKIPKRTIFLNQWLGMQLIKASLPFEAFEILQESVLKFSDAANLGTLRESVACLGELKRFFPSLNADPHLLEVFLKLAPLTSKAESASFGSAIFPFAIARIGEAASKELLPKIMTSVKDSNEAPYKALRALLAAQTADTNAALTNIKQLEPDLRKWHPSLFDAIQILNGQLQYTNGNFDGAIGAWGRIGPESNFFAEAVRGTSWAQLSLNKYSSAVGSAYNLIVGPLQNTFQPDAYLIIAIALNEVCDYPRAMETIKTYKRAYGKAHLWLEDWQKTKPAIYPQLAKFLKGNSEVPVFIGLEWAKNPFFLATQEAINEIFSERSELTQLKSILPKGAPFQGFVEHRYAENISREKRIVMAINVVLESETLKMQRTLDKVSDEIQLVHADVLSSVGEKMIVDNAGTSLATKKQKVEQASKKSASVWDWGNISMDDDREPEFWSDELGYLKAEAKNQCVK